MTITESHPSNLIRMQVAFLRPMKATNDTEFTFTPEGDQTVVTWTMTGRNGLIAKAFGLLVNIDKLVGKDFEKGLATLKSLVEGKSIRLAS